MGDAKNTATLFGGINFRNASLLDL
jgi:hypothetical protein